MAVIKRTRRTKKKVTVSYQAEVYVDGVRLASRSFDTQAAAHTWHDTEKDRLASGRKEAAKEITVAELVAKYLAEHADAKWRAATKDSFASRLPYFVNAPFKDVSLSDLTDKHCDEWLDWLLIQPGRSNPQRKSFKQEVVWLSCIFKWWSNYHRPTFVSPICQRHRERAKYKQVQQRRADHFIRPEDIAPWIAWLRENLADPVYWRAAAFQVLTGMRIGEVAGLHWDCVDLPRKIVSVTRTVSWDRKSYTPTVEDATKTNESNRAVRLCQELVTMLAGLESGGREGAVFKHLNGKLLNYGLAKYYYSRAFKKLGLPWRATHILRHSWATLGLMANGGNLASIQAALGHASPKTTQKYAKVVALIADDTADKVGALVSAHHVQDHVKPASGAKLAAVTTA